MTTRTVTLDSVCSRISSGGTPSRKKAEYFTTGLEGHLWVKSKELLDGSIQETEETITDEGLNNSPAKHFPAHAVLIAMYGANVGQLGWLRVPATVNQAICGFVLDDQRADWRFVFYELLQRRGDLAVQAHGAAQQNLNQDLIRQFSIRLPPLPQQRRIACILSAYDDLIENSQRRIFILEAMARALYREWFVAFRFPGHDKTPRVDSPLGDIPQGWEVKLVKEILARRTGGTVYRKADVRPEGATPVIDQSTNELLGFHDNDPDHLASLVKPLAIFGDHTCKMQLLVEPFSVGPNVVPFAAIDDLPTAYVFHAVRSLIHTQEYKRHWIPLSVKEVIVADHATALRFASFISPMLAIQETLRKSIRNLRRTRDLLLPCLLSGQVALTETGA